MEKKEVVTGIALDKKIAKIGILKVPDQPGIAAKVFNALAKENINVDMIVQSMHSAGLQADMAFTVGETDEKKALEITRKVAKELNAEGAVSDPEAAKVSLVGVGMVSQPGVAAKMFDTLAKENINIEMISTSEIRVSCVVREKDGEKAVRVLHKAFGLEK
jgi:aspartate kinase